MKLVWLNSLNSDEISINTELYIALSTPEKIIVHFGSLKASLNVTTNDELEARSIALPISLFESYTIPKEIPYEVYFNKGELFIGPIITHVSLGANQFYKKSYATNLPYFLNYNEIKGLIITCTENSIDLDSGIIEGYYLDPGAVANKSPWKQGRFPLPNAVFNHSFMSQEKISAIQEKLGDKVFNSYLLNLDKWQFWKFLSRSNSIRKHLPYTEELKTMKRMKSLLNKYGSLYLKPCNEGGGIGIMKVSKTPTGITLIDNSSKEYNFTTYEELQKFLINQIANIVKRTKSYKRRDPLLFKFLGNQLTTPYILQQAVPFKKGNRQVDFRLVLQKNDRLQWSFTGLVARISQEGSIITNKRGRDKMIPGSKALTDIYGVNPPAAKKIVEEMTSLITKVAEMYEGTGYHLGDIVADIALDKNLNIWLLEIQLYYSIKGWYTRGLRKFYENVATTPFKYAKALAGFVNKDSHNR